MIIIIIIIKKQTFQKFLSPFGNESFIAHAWVVREFWIRRMPSPPPPGKRELRCWELSNHKPLEFV